MGVEYRLADKAYVKMLLHAVRARRAIRAPRRRIIRHPSRVGLRVRRRSIIIPSIDLTPSRRPFPPSA